ncbi:hypothetical protein ANN_23171 [Periplaneta americana]|uniref:Uncharacterized protein n=1 Tax=Periplaneta americana TaxID=6978 RepID=A0ABQ8SKD3_PERAM|nr:hypothetical protein ANN_23171 [Periplaneta americana]
MAGLCEGGSEPPSSLKVSEMSPGSSTESYPAFAHIGLRENPGKNLNQVTCPDRESNPGHLVSRPDALTVTPQSTVIKRHSDTPSPPFSTPSPALLWKTSPSWDIPQLTVFLSSPLVSLSRSPRLLLTAGHPYFQERKWQQGGEGLQGEIPKRNYSNEEYRVLLGRKHYHKCWVLVRMEHCLEVLLERFWSSILKQKFDVHQEVSCIATKSSPRRADVFVIDRQNNETYIIDPTARCETGSGQSDEVDEEKKGIPVYEPTMDYFLLLYLLTYWTRNIL